jgi:hypothetical protein
MVGLLTKMCKLISGKDIFAIEEETEGMLKEIIA